MKKLHSVIDSDSHQELGASISPFPHKTKERDVFTYRVGNYLFIILLVAHTQSLCNSASGGTGNVRLGKNYMKLISLAFLNDASNYLT